MQQMSKEIDDLKQKLKEREELEQKAEQWKEELQSLCYLRAHIEALHQIIHDKNDNIYKQESLTSELSEQLDKLKTQFGDLAQQYEDVQVESR